MTGRSRVSVELGGVRFERWESYKLAADILTPSDSFTLTMGLPGTRADRRQVKQLFSARDDVRVYVYPSDDAAARPILQQTGLVDQRDTVSDREHGSRVTLECRDLAAHLVDSACDLSVASGDGEQNFIELVRLLVAPWHITVVVDASASRDLATGASMRLPPVARISRSAFSEGVPPDLYSPDFPVVIDDADVAADQDLEVQRRARWIQGRLTRTVGSAPVGSITGIDPDHIPAIARQRARAAVARAAARGQSASGLTAPYIRALKAREARPQPGEQVWTFILRHCKRFGLVPWMSPAGQLVIASPNYGSAPVHRLVRRLQDDASDPNTILSGGETFNVGDRYSEVRVYGKSPGGDATRSSVHAVVRDDSMPYPRLRVMQDDDVRTDEEAQRVAQREMARVKHGQQTLSYLVRGHGDGRHLYAVDTVVSVLDEVADVEGEFYVVARVLEGSRDGATRTQLRLVQKGAILL